MTDELHGWAEKTYEPASLGIVAEAIVGGEPEKAEGINPGWRWLIWARERDLPAYLEAIDAMHATAETRAQKRCDYDEAVERDTDRSRLRWRSEARRRLRGIPIDEEQKRKDFERWRASSWGQKWFSDADVEAPPRGEGVKCNCYDGESTKREAREWSV